MPRSASASRCRMPRRCVRNSADDDLARAATSTGWGRRHRSTPLPPPGAFLRGGHNLAPELFYRTCLLWMQGMAMGLHLPSTLNFRICATLEPPSLPVPPWRSCGLAACSTSGSRCLPSCEICLTDRASAGSRMRHGAEAFRPGLLHPEPLRRLILRACSLNT